MSPPGQDPVRFGKKRERASTKRVDNPGCDDQAGCDEMDNIDLQKPTPVQQSSSGKGRGVIFGGRYASVQTIEMDAADEDPGEPQPSLTIAMLGRIGLIDSAGTPQPEAMRRTFVGVFLACIILTLIPIPTNAGSAKSASPPVLADGLVPVRPPPPPVPLPAIRYVANRGYTCKLDNELGNALTEANLPPAKASSEGEPCWSEAQALSVARAARACTFVTNGVPELGGSSCLTSVRFCEEPISDLAETTENTNLVTCRVLDLPQPGRRVAALPLLGEDSIHAAAAEASY